MDNAGMRFTKFLHYLLTRGLGFLGLHWRPMLYYFFTYDIKNCCLFSVTAISLDILCRLMTFSEHHSVYFPVVQK